MENLFYFIVYRLYLYANIVNLEKSIQLTVCSGYLMLFEDFFLGQFKLII